MPAFYNGTAYPVAETIIGLGKEATRGTPVAPTYYFPVKSPAYKPDLMLIPDDTIQGSMNTTYDLVTGIRYDAHGWSAPPYLDSFPLLALCELGYQTTTAASAATTISVATTPQNPTSAPFTMTVAAQITGTAASPNGVWITFGSATAGTIESHQVIACTTVSPWVVTLAEPVRYAHASGTVVSGMTAHQFSLLNNFASSSGTSQPPSLTISDWDGDQWRQISAAQLDELNIKGNGTGLTDYTCTLMGNPSVTPSSPSPSYTGVQTPAPWSMFSLIGGSYTPTIMDWEFDLKRGVKPIPALTGAQQYFEYFAGPITAGGKYTLVEQSGSPYLTDFLNAQRLVLDHTTFDQRTGSAMNIHGSNGQFKTGSLSRANNGEWVTVPVDFDLLPSAADAPGGGVGPVVITIAQPSGVGQTTAY